MDGKSSDNHVARAVSLDTLTRAVAGVMRSEDRDIGRAALRVLLRAYHEDDQQNGRDCPGECPFCPSRRDAP